MATVKLADSVAMLEAEAARLKAELRELKPPKKSWTDEIAGTFANDPYYEEAMRLGREWRESQRPKPRKKRRSENGDS